MAPPEITVTRERGQYAGGPCGLSMKLKQDGEDLNEIFVYDRDVPVFLAHLVRALTPEQRIALGQIIDVEEVA